jgi:hypothetical protein
MLKGDSLTGFTQKIDKFWLFVDYLFNCVLWV